MTKDKTTKKDSTKSDKSTEKTNRGRPSSNKKEVEVKDKKYLVPKNDDTKNNITTDSKPVDKVIDVSSKLDNTDKTENKIEDVSDKAPDVIAIEKAIEPVVSEEEYLFSVVYGNEPLKESAGFPNSEQITQTIAKLKECNIIVGRLPNDVLSLVNEFVNAFTIFTSNPMLGFHMINEIQEKDAKAIEALNNWIEPRKNALIKLNGGISISESTTTNTASVIDDKKVIIDSKNVSTVTPTMPIVNANVTNPNVIPAIQSNANSNISNQQNNGLPFVSQSSENSYQHHVHSNNSIVNSPVPISMNENKDIHAEMLSKNNAFLDVHKNQSPLNNGTQQQAVAIDPQKYFTNYAETIIALIKGVWQFGSWGYIPTSVLMDILNGSDKGFSYEVVKYDDDTVSINISKGADSISTERFSCKN